ncbi:unnamed protein product [Rhizophagus irregularis]|nr:unnamed protein product [Rhizophagus irregularis]
MHSSYNNVTFNKICSDYNKLSERLLSSFSYSEKKTFRRTLVKRSTFVNHFSIHTGSSKNSLFPEFTPPAVASAFTPDDLQDDSPDMAIDPVLQSVIRAPAFQRICHARPDRYTRTWP